MLDGLDSVQWGRLTHAYGTAEDVPELIRGLRSADADVRRNALHELYGNIYHQGKRYEASPYAVPFLLELVNDSAAADRAEVLLLLTALAIGQARWPYPDGFPITADRATVARTESGEYKRLVRLSNAWLDSFDGGEGRTRH